MSAIPFEVTFAGYLFLAGFEGKKEVIGMVPADIRTTAAEGLEPDRILPTLFALLLFCHQ